MNPRARCRSASLLVLTSALLLHAAISVTASRAPGSRSPAPGAVTSSSATSPSAGIRDTSSPLDAFTAAIAAIPDNAADPVPRAQAALRRFARTERDAEKRDSVALTFRAFVYDIAEKWNANSPSLDITSRVPRTLRARIRANGMEFASSEGIYYVRPQPAFLPRAVSGLVSPAVAAFLRLEAADARKPWQEDGGLAIGWTDLALRVVAWDQLLDRHPISPVSREAEIIRFQYARAFWTGTENSPAFDWTPEGAQGPVRPEIRDAVAVLERRHATARFTHDCRQWLQILDRNGGRTSPAIAAFLAAHGIASAP